MKGEILWLLRFAYSEGVHRLLTEHGFAPNNWSRFMHVLLSGIWVGLAR